MTLTIGVPTIPLQQELEGLVFFLTLIISLFYYFNDLKIFDYSLLFFKYTIVYSRRV